MNLQSFKFIADENIPGAVIEALNAKGIDTISISELLPKGEDDDTVIDTAIKADRVFITQDMGFGKSQFIQSVRKAGIIYVYPGHVGSDIINEILTHLFKQIIDVEVPFIVVAQKKGTHIKVRSRNLFYQ